MEKNNKGFGAACKEAFRKFLVGLKRKPHMIPLVAFVIAFLEYSLNLTCISNTTARIQGSGMGLCGFVTMLFSMLSLVCFNNAYPHRKPVNKPMWILMLVMNGIIAFADYHYMQSILSAITRANDPIVITSSLAYIAKAYNMLNTHLVMLAVAVVLTFLLPVYSKWIKKINTNVAVEDNGNLASIDISGED